MGRGLTSECRGASYVRWSHVKGKRLWDSGMPIAEMATRLNTSPNAIKQFAQRHGWTPRKKWRRQQTNGYPDLPETVTRRCPDCMGVFDGVRNVRDAQHQDCPRRRMAA
jgi:hypothetical protein